MFRRLIRSGPEREALPNHQQLASDIELIERYSDASKFQVGAYWKTVADMRSAVARLLEAHRCDYAVHQSAVACNRFSTDRP